MRRNWRWRLLSYERRAWFPRMGKAAFVAADFEMVSFDTAVRSLLDFEVAKDVLLNGTDDAAVNGGEDLFCSLG